MIHGVRISGGRAEWYRNRWVRQAPVSRALREPRRTYRVSRGMDAASNINVIGHAGRTLFLTEGGTLPFELTDELDTVGPATSRVICTGRCLLIRRSTRSPATSTASATSRGRPRWDYTVVAATGAVVRSESIELPHATMMHDFALTPSYLVLMDLPVTFHALSPSRATRSPSDGTRGRWRGWVSCGAGAPRRSRSGRDRARVGLPHRQRVRHAERHRPRRRDAPIHVPRTHGGDQRSRDSVARTLHDRHAYGSSEARDSRRSPAGVPPCR